MEMEAKFDSFSGMASVVSEITEAILKFEKDGMTLRRDWDIHVSRQARSTYIDVDGQCLPISFWKKGDKKFCEVVVADNFDQAIRVDDWAVEAADIEYCYRCYDGPDVWWEYKRPAPDWAISTASERVGKVLRVPVNVIRLPDLIDALLAMACQQAQRTVRNAIW